MLLSAAKQIFDTSEETKGYEIDWLNDVALVVNNYIFVVQTKNGFNNIIFHKCYDSKTSLKDTLQQFRTKLQELGVQYVRIEGTKTRYRFLSKMFPQSSFMQSDEVENRNIFYCKV